MSPDAIHGLASVLEKGWGSHGYRFEKIEPDEFGGGGARALVAHSDGSRFLIAVDRWGQEVRLAAHQRCPEFAEDGTCIHSDCMMSAGL